MLVFMNRGGFGTDHLCLCINMQVVKLQGDLYFT